ncbi:MAG: hypothetical protein ACI83D_000604 [Planctomycetota bacterium]|jgi:hypothetical protein
MNLKLLFTITGIILTFASFGIYYHDMFKGITKPHMFTWLLWTSLTSIAFAGQLAGGGGAGSYITGVTALTSLGVLVFAIFHGEKTRTFLDWASLILALIAIGLWLATGSPLWAVIMVTSADVLAYVPTLRKSFSRPNEETLSSYVIAFFKFGLGVVALEHFSVTTWLYPGALMIMSLILSGLLIWRRKAISEQVD